jgi:hypothetical protein
MSSTGILRFCSSVRIAARLARSRRRDAAQQVVAAELDQREVGRGLLRVEHEPDPLQRGRAGVARDAGIDHLRADPAPRQRALQPLGIALVRTKAVAGEQTVSERRMDRS